jgi:CubicO group peptidase (beta-lactamase class C family)
MMLIEEGKLKLDEPIDLLAPELADHRVLKRIDGPLDDTVPAKRAITLEDVLTFRLGWGVLFADTYPIARATADLPGFGMPNPKSSVTPDQFMQRLGALPLMAQPGEQWLYTAGSNVLGVLVARAAGKPLDAVLSERILAPLGMKDTAFHSVKFPLSQLSVTGSASQTPGRVTGARMSVFVADGWPFVRRRFHRRRRRSAVVTGYMIAKSLAWISP